jgi:hypothetical protein
MERSATNPTEPDINTVYITPIGAARLGFYVSSAIVAADSYPANENPAVRSPIEQTYNVPRPSEANPVALLKSVKTKLEEASFGENMNTARIKMID